MIKLTITPVLVITLTFSAAAQYFAPVGAKWTYDYAPGIINSPPYTVEQLTIKITKDTLINGLTCREAVVAISGVTQANKYIRSVNDSVLVYSPVNNRFNLLYDFNVSVGDTLQIFTDGPWVGGVLFSSYVKIDSVGFKNIKGINYRAYHQTCLRNMGNCLKGGSGWVIDSLGIIEPYYGWPYPDKISYLFLTPISAGPSNAYPLRCYTDNNTNYNYDYTNCDTTYVVTNVQETNTYKFSVYPTLLSHKNKYITIKARESLIPKQIKLFSLTGVENPITISRYKTKTKLLLNNKIPSGIYLLKFQFINEWITHKIIVL